MTDEIRRALCKHNKDNPSLTQKQLQEWVHSNYGLQVIKRQYRIHELIIEKAKKFMKECIQWKLQRYFFLWSGLASSKQDYGKVKNFRTFWRDGSVKDGMEVQIKIHKNKVDSLKMKDTFNMMKQTHRIILIATIASLKEKTRQGKTNCIAICCNEDDAMNLANFAWTMDVSANTIANCFRHCKLRSTDNIQNLIKELGYRNAMDVEDVLTHPEENVVAQVVN
ncbi:hypothetical protein Tco_0890051 [Tanacetum coccineum]